MVMVAPSVVACSLSNVPAPPLSVIFDASAIVTASLKVSTMLPLTATSVAPVAGVELLNVGFVVSVPVVVTV